MPDTKDIAGLLEEVQTLVQGLRDEKSDLRDQVNRLEAQLSLVKEEKSQEGKKLQDINDQLTKELHDTKIRLSGELQRTQEKLDRFHPELQSLQDELQNAELKNNLLEMKVLKKDEELKSLEARLRTYTSLDSAALSVEEPIV
ncbi:MAG: hypothetical protein OEZ57_01110 [Nitrospirota bacterium]|nr:hypothetical protein [Nitrospirota bacterium]MDH5585207.1 hypothetical protein [Nitrospirota bacterium]MDH5773498.1 hypothetical protein [Nitrospirota bacterium]